MTKKEKIKTLTDSERKLLKCKYRKSGRCQLNHGGCVFRYDNKCDVKSIKSILLSKEQDDKINPCCQKTAKEIFEDFKKKGIPRKHDGVIMLRFVPNDWENLKKKWRREVR